MLIDSMDIITMNISTLYRCVYTHRRQQQQSKKKYSTYRRCNDIVMTLQTSFDAGFFFCEVV